MIMKVNFTILLIFLQIFFSHIVNSQNVEEIDIANLWLSKSSGTWELENKYGFYQVMVLRTQGREHSQDEVYIQIIRKSETGNIVVRTVKLNSPGYKGFVKNIELINIDEINMLALHLDIEMKAMNGITMREIYLISPDGKVKSLIEAGYIDLYE